MMCFLVLLLSTSLSMSTGSFTCITTRSCYPLSFGIAIDLSDVVNQGAFERCSSVVGSITISGQAMFTLPCLNSVTNIFVENNFVVNDFQLASNDVFPVLSTISGALRIHNTSLSSLLGLGQLIQSPLEIVLSSNFLLKAVSFDYLRAVGALSSFGKGLVVSNNSLLESISLQSLFEVYGELKFSSNVNLKTVSIPNLERVTSTLALVNLSVLSDVSFLSALDVVGSLTVVDLPQLLHLPLSLLSTVENINLTNLLQLNSLGTFPLQSATSIVLENIPKLRGLPFGGLITVSSLRLVNLSSLVSLDLVALQRVPQTFFLADLPLLSSLESLSGLTSAGAFTLAGCSRLQSMRGLHHLSMLRAFSLIGNGNLSSLVGLGNLTTISGPFVVQGCPLITSLCGVENLRTVGALTVTPPHCHLFAILYSSNLILLWVSSAPNAALL
jgi:hypothetical protein